MHYKLIILVALILSTACSDDEKSTSTTENSDENETNVSIEIANNILDEFNKKFHPVEPKSINNPEPVIHENKLNLAHFSLSEFSMNEATLIDIAVMFGEALFLPDPETETHRHVGEKLVCYISSNENDKTLVLLGAGFYSDYEDFNSMTIYADRDDFSKSTLCTSTTLVNKDISTQSGIHIGMRIDQLISILDYNVQLNGNQFTYKGGYLETGSNGIELYYSQNVTATLDENTLIDYIRIDTHSERWGN
jgi:hypothetical protein